ncbi:vif protein [Simian immunodeficiency virus]|uniref:Virion infectivity factor n=1 Tax=Simian immunodeficiency virus TaxID=11723 RepID=Q90DD1_SIV|nr:vif protein [Simian immunodeficiency virus]
MEEGKRWVAVPVWRISRRIVERWHSCIKFHKYKTRELEKACYVPHHKVGWAWYTASRVIFPLEEGSHLEVQVYWNLTPEKGWLSSYAVRITWYSEKFWTDVTPDVADQLAHSTYFPCFAAHAVRQAIRGEQVLSYCGYAVAHHSSVQSLQLLALKVVLQNDRPKGKNPTRKQWRRNNRRGLRMVTQYSGGPESNSSTTPTKRVNFPGLEKVLGILGR